MTENKNRDVELIQETLHISPRFALDALNGDLPSALKGLFRHSFDNALRSSTSLIRVALVNLIDRYPEMPRSRWAELQAHKL